MPGFLRAKNTFLAILFLGLFIMATRNVTDPDVWWHLKTGQYIAEHKAVPRTDPFSFTRSGERWVAHEWLTDLLLYEAQRYAGGGGLILLFAVILSATFYFIYLRCGSALYVAGIATLAGAWTTMAVWGVRPQVVSLLLTSLWLLILERSENHPNLLWWTLPLTVLWVNLHAGFALGLVLSALFLAGDWLELGVGGSHSIASRQRMEAFILALDCLLVPLNPNGMRMFRYPVETLRSPAMQNYIAEWASPNFHHSDYWPFLMLILTTFAITARLRRQLRPRDVLLLIVSLYAGLSSIRMIPIFVFVALPLLSRQVGSWREFTSAPEGAIDSSSDRSAEALRHPKSAGHNQKPVQESVGVFQQTAGQHQPATGLRLWLNGAIVLGMVAFTASHAFKVIRSQAEAESRHFPTQAVAYLQEHPAGGPIFNHYGWGGYLIWKLYPIPVFIDGRADLYGELLNQFAKTYSFQADWQKPLQQWKISTVLVPPDAALAAGLRSAPDWTVCYEDAQAIILTHCPAATGTRPEMRCPTEPRGRRPTMPP